MSEPTARVTLVGAGPGAVDLITIRGRRALEEADVVVYDDLVDPGMLAYCRPEAVRLHMGKRAAHAATTQDEIGAVLVREARAGKRVVRLKGGDPLVFGRGGEEAAVLANSGVPFSIVPGVTAALAAGAVAGIPLTHRDAAPAVIFVTGHECPGKRGPSVDWRALAATGATLCIYMGVRRLVDIAGQLREGGLPDDTPLAVVSHATLPEQSITVTTLSGAASLEQPADWPPALIIVGEVVRLARAPSPVLSEGSPAPGGGSGFADAIRKFLNPDPAEVENFNGWYPELPSDVFVRPAGRPERTELADLLAQRVRDELDDAFLLGGKARVALVDHGSVKAASALGLDALAAALAGKLSREVEEVEACSMEGRGLLLEDLLDRPGWNEGPVVVAMLFLLPGRHAGPGGDIDVICSLAKGRHPGLRIRRTRLLGEGSPLPLSI